MRLVVRDSLRPVRNGLLIGLTLAVAAAVGLSRLLYGVEAVDPVVLAGVSTETEGRAQRWAEFIKRLARVSEISSAPAAPKGSVQLVVRGEVAALPMVGIIDLDAERARLAKEMQKAEADILGLLEADATDDRETILEELQLALDVAALDGLLDSLGVGRLAYEAGGLAEREVVRIGAIQRVQRAEIGPLNIRWHIEFLLDARIDRIDERVGPPPTRHQPPAARRPLPADLSTPDPCAGELKKVACIMPIALSARDHEHRLNGDRCRCVES